jgi:hypothetical protein
MAWLWEEATGKKPSKTYPTYSDQKPAFVSLVFDNLEKLGYTPETYESLAKTIQRTLS